MSRTQFFRACATDGTELANLFAECVGIPLAQRQLWLIQFMARRSA